MMVTMPKVVSAAGVVPVRASRAGPTERCVVPAARLSSFNGRSAVLLRNKQVSRSNGFASLRVSAEESASTSEEEDFEARIERFGKKGKRPRDEVAAKRVERAAAPSKSSSAAAAPTAGQGLAVYTNEDVEDDGNFGSETIYWEGPPHRGDLVSNIALSWTLIWIPLTIAAIGRAAWLKYKVTDKRVAIISTSPIRNERSDIPYSEMTDIVSIGRGLGIWGDMVITLRSGDKVEMRSVPNHKEMEKYIREKFEALAPKNVDAIGF